VRQIALLRGINIGARNRVAMPKLRKLLEEAGFEDVGTYLQSGNVVLSSDLTEKGLARKVKRVVADSFGLEVEVVVRSRNELAKVVRLNPLGDIATNPKRYQVSFLAKKPSRAVVRELTELAAPSEKLVARGRELYAWHPAGVARSKLWARLAGKQLGVVATARNWTTVTSLLELADKVKA
jgi:uncharacterized protein (DUF1697 family)